MNRRADIQVMRALAVLCVIVFHLDEAWLPLGYLGVDIFFVISGFVITRGILERSVNGHSFDPREFLMRRINRLLPALLFTLVISVAAGVLLYSPQDLKALADTALYAMGGLSNLYFFTQTDYFSAPLETMPLLHTWSLSVEEQFYLLFALISTLIVSAGGNFLSWSVRVWSLLLLVSLAFIASDLDWFVDLGPIKALALEDTANAAHFYLLPARIYQLALGILGACAIVRYGSVGLTDKTRGLTWQALFYALLGSVVFLPEGHATGVWVSLVTLALLLVGEDRQGGWIPRYLVSLAPVGDRSYSLYLVHWPVIVFLSFYAFGRAQLLTVVLAAVLTALLGEISYRKFENRRKPRPGVTAMAGGPMPSFLIYTILFFACSAFFVSSNGGIESRMQTGKAPKFFSYQKNFRKTAWKPTILGENDSRWGKLKRISPRRGGVTARVLVIGDSHAEVLKHMAEYFASTRNHRWEISSFAGCPPIFGHFKVYDITRRAFDKKQQACREQVDRWEKYVRQHGDKYDWIVLASRWNWLFNHDPFNGMKIRPNALVRVGQSIDRSLSAEQWRELSKANFVPGLKHTIEIIGEAGARPVVMGQPPLSSRPLLHCDAVPRYLFTAGDIRARCNLDSYRDIVARGQFVDEILRNPAAQGISGVDTLVPIDLFCDHVKKSCQKVVHGRRISNDDNHYNRFGAIYAAKNWESADDFPFAARAADGDDS